MEKIAAADGQRMSAYRPTSPSSPHAYRAEGRTKKARLEKKGWKFGSTASFLGLSREESDRLDIDVARKRLADPNEVPMPYEKL